MNELSKAFGSPYRCTGRTLSSVAQISSCGMIGVSEMLLSKTVPKIFIILPADEGLLFTIPGQSHYEDRW
jgi:hypothetical protein